ncbi:IS21-like element helper ATPase IstB [Myxococcota bacterium]|nr:IS21-like element helper ATPase IstB [Myxococcota bacterium]MCZ7619438.1 IS21-like element helper ATPase IstB [Myxococcota bacterium]
MLTHPTLEQLSELRLHALARAWRGQQDDPSLGDLGFDERLALLVEAEWSDRQNKRLGRLLREAKLRITGACLEDLDYVKERNLDRSLVRQLAGGRWIEAHHNVVISGATGVGKTFLACALAQQACRLGYRALYRRAPRLFDELALARADGTYPRLLARFARTDVLVLDDWGLAPVAETDRRDLLEIMDDRHGLRSTIWTSQIPVAQWHDHVGDPTVADAICDRLLHNAHRIVLQGPSRRKQKTTEG